MPRPDPQPTESSDQNPRQQRPRRRWLMPFVIVGSTAALIAAVLGVDAAMKDRTGETGEGGQARPAASASAAGSPGRGAREAPSEVALPDLSGEERRDPDDLLAEGPVDAPVVLVVFTDYQCPYCAQWAHETAPVMREYVERGELRIEWRDVNVYGEDSERAARASLAAAKQGEHIAYQQHLFAGGKIRTGQGLSEKALVALAGELGLDEERFRADMDSEQTARAVADNARQGGELGVMSTPAFIIGGTPTVGAQPTEVFTQMVDDALAEAR